MLRAQAALVVLLAVGSTPVANLVCALTCAAHRQASAATPHHCDAMPPAPVALKAEHCPDLEVHGPLTAVGLVTASATPAIGAALPASPLFAAAGLNRSDKADAASPPRPQRPLTLRI